MQNEVQIFSNSEFGEIRTVTIDNEPWFVAKDIAEKLGYVKTCNMTKQIDDEDKRIFDSFSQKDANYFNPKTRNIGLINESGLYSAIMGSKLPNAKKFRRWVTSEVLPTILKTGSYQMPTTTEGKIALLAQGHTELTERVNNIQSELETLKMDLPILPIEADKITEAVKRKGVSVMGGKQSNAYNNRNIRQKVYNNMYANLKYNFGTRSYKAIKRCQCDKAIEIIQSYQPPFFLQQTIETINAQGKLF